MPIPPFAFQFVVWNALYLFARLQSDYATLAATSDAMKWDFKAMQIWKDLIDKGAVATWKNSDLEQFKRLKSAQSTSEKRIEDMLNAETLWPPARWFSSKKTNVNCLKFTNTIADIYMAYYSSCQIRINAPLTVAGGKTLEERKKYVECIFWKFDKVNLLINDAAKARADLTLYPFRETVTQRDETTGETRNVTVTLYYKAREEDIRREIVKQEAEKEKRKQERIQQQQTKRRLFEKDTVAK